MEFSPIFSEHRFATGVTQTGWSAMQQFASISQVDSINFSGSILSPCRGIRKSSNSLLVLRVKWMMRKNEVINYGYDMQLSFPSNPDYVASLSSQGCVLDDSSLS